MRSKYRKYVLFLLYCGMMLWLLLARTPNEAGVPFSVYFHTISIPCLCGPSGGFPGCCSLR